MARLCKECNKTRITGHFNAKYCAPCRKKLLKKPKGTLTKKQIAFAKKHKNDMTRKEICEALEVSLSNLKRSCRDVKFQCSHLKKNKYLTNPKLVEKVLRFYEKNGKKKTQEKFPDVSVRSIVERYKDFKPRQIRWKDKELIELTKMAGLVSFKDQAKWFNRPNANAGSIKSAWVKKFKTSQETINGMAHYKAKHFVKKSAPYIKTPFGSGSGNAKRILLWVDMEKHLRKDAPNYVKESVLAMAEFQRKLFGVNNVRRKVLQMIKERTI